MHIWIKSTEQVFVFFIFLWQIAEAEILEDQLLVALGHRILELVEKLEDFDLILLLALNLRGH